MRVIGFWAVSTTGNNPVWLNLLQLTHDSVGSVERQILFEQHTGCGLSQIGAVTHHSERPNFLFAVDKINT